MNAQITLSETRTAATEAPRSNFRPDMPVIVVYENGRRTPGQWYADTIAENTGDVISIDFGQNWNLTKNETALLRGFAIGVVAALEQPLIAAEVKAVPQHTVRGQTSDEGFPYGTRHDSDCPACEHYFGDNFVGSPRSEAFWAS